MVLFAARWRMLACKPRPAELGLLAITRTPGPREVRDFAGHETKANSHGSERPMGSATESSPPGNPRLSRRVRREQRTMRVMIRMYCVGHHQGLQAPFEIELPSGPRARDGLCHECAAVLDYSFRRIESCRFGDEKPTCAQCAVHCFRPETRDHVRTVMRYSGPRMTIRHPYLALRHLLDARKSYARTRAMP